MCRQRARRRIFKFSSFFSVISCAMMIMSGRGEEEMILVFLFLPHSYLLYSVKRR